MLGFWYGLCSTSHSESPKISNLMFHLCSSYVLSCIFRIFSTFCFEKYLTYFPSILRKRVLKFRLSNHRLPIQQRRSFGIPSDERICTVCDNGKVGDEFHSLLNCSNENVKRNRTKYVDKYYTHHPNVPKFCSLMNMTSISKNIKLAKFISCILELF